MPRPVIALLSDFGTHDHYVGVMRGVMLDICPDAALADITHEIQPQDVLGGALELGAAFKYFPAATVLLAVVDPGVGSARRGIAAEAGGRFFVAPDNGLLTAVFKDAPPARVVELKEPRYALPDVSRTFEGRDRFAPAAAWLARGVDLAALGPELPSWQLLAIPEPVATDDRIVGEVLRVDRFGNLVTNIDRQTFDRLAHGSATEVRAPGHSATQIVANYSEADTGSLCALFGSTEHLEIAVSGGNAAERLRLGRGAQITVMRRHQD